MKTVTLLVSALEDAERIYGILSESLSVVQVIVEEKVPRKTVLKRRIRRYGVIAVFGQVLMVLFTSVLRALSLTRIKELNRLMPQKKIPEKQLQYVSSINSKEALELLERMPSSALLVYGTRLFSKTTLSHIHTPILNIHAGITPRYRGGHGAYWALREGHPEFAGVTLHYIDEGIDTGEIISQATIPITKKDNFVTYPLLQLKEGVVLAKNFLIEGRRSVLSQSPEPSDDILSHPTLWEYVYYWTTSGVH